MQQSSINLSALIGSRICHDLISPIGAINNGLELLGMTAKQASPEMALISESVENATARIRFFRVAYGATGNQLMGRPEVVSVLKDLAKGSRLTYDWIPQDPMPRAQVRLVFLGLQCVETAMPFGGNVTMRVENDRWHLQATAEKLNLEEDLWNNIEGAANNAPVSPAQVQFALLPLLTAEMGRKLSIEVTETTIELQF
ncbi:MAG: histidine phosphotransferase family protein [Paracoccaceae bacterium]